MRNIHTFFARFRVQSRDTSLAALAPRSVDRAFLRILGAGLVALAFVPSLVPVNHLLGMFTIDAPHNALRLLTGVVALTIARMPKRTHAWYGTAAISIFYGLLTVLGFAQHDTILGLMRVNFADNLMHLLIALAALAAVVLAEYSRVFPSFAALKTLLGIGGKPKKTDKPPTTPRRNATA